jgi:hypothetical protein
LFVLCHYLGLFSYQLKKLGIVDHGVRRPGRAFNRQQAQHEERKQPGRPVELR